MARGGKRLPASPAPVSGPGALSRRTDGGPGDQGQPIRVASGGDYGSRQGLENLQAAAPLAAAPSPPSPAGGSAVSPPAPLGGVPLSAPPTMPMPAAPSSRQIIPEDPNTLLRALYRIYPHPDIARLLPPGG